MPLWISHVCERLLTFWLTATPHDFGRMSILIVVFGWFLMRPKP